MEKTLSHDNSTIGPYSRSGTNTSRPKFDNVQRLTTIVNELQQTTTQQSNQEMPVKVLDTIKEKIKNNYDKLYDDYDTNKKTILKNIQQTENNRAGEDALKSKFDNVIKEKQHYDKLKDEFDRNQRKLKKMIDLRNQMKQSSQNSSQLSNILEDRAALVNHFEEYRKNLDYETAVLNNMKSDRKKLKLTLKERQQKMLKQDLTKKERIKKLRDGNHTKAIILKRIQDKIYEEENHDLPEPLTEQLQKRLEQYEGKYAHLNILKHQNKKSKQRLEEEKEQEQKCLKMAKKEKQLREKEEKKEFQTTYNNYLLRQVEQEKLKRLCGVDNLNQIVENKFVYDHDQLQKIRQKIDSQISTTKGQITKINEEIKSLITTSEEGQSCQMLKKQQQCEEEKKQLRRLRVHVDKQQKYLIEWQGCIQQFLKCQRSNMIDKLKEILPKYENLCIKQRVEGNDEERRERKMKKNSKLIHKNQSLNLSQSGI